jgi:hypothetical protein
MPANFFIIAETFAISANDGTDKIIFHIYSLAEGLFSPEAFGNKTS